MVEKELRTNSGNIHYWTDSIDSDKLTLIFLSGLTADHSLFDKQIEYFKGKYNLIVWDPPAHGNSWPFDINFSLMDLVKWLNEILEVEGVKKPIIIGQSMGGYIGQAYAQDFPGNLKGFISIDSAPLQRDYFTNIELWLLKRMEPIYYYFPWKWLLKVGTNGVATTQYGRDLMFKIMMSYDGDKKRYSKLAGHGMKIVAEAVELNLKYDLNCPTLLICGDKDQAGSCRRYNKAWHQKTGYPIAWIKNAGHNSNTDQPEIVNNLIDMFISDL